MKDQIDILLIEDTPSDIRLTEEALKRSDLNYKMTVVHDGVEAMKHLSELKDDSERPLPDVILLDLNMPKKNGHEVLADIKDDKEYASIPVILLTVSQREEDVMEALRLKMNYYLAKPVTAQKLSALIKSIHDVQNLDMGDIAPGTEEEVHIRLVLACNPHTSPAILSKLAQDKNERVRCRVAENERSPASVLKQLAADESPDVRLCVSENEKVTEDILIELAKDESEDVRLGISANPKVPEHILKTLASDENVFVSQKASNTLDVLSQKV